MNRINSFLSKLSTRKHKTQKEIDNQSIIGTNSDLPKYRILPNLRFAYALPIVIIFAGFGMYSIFFSKAATPTSCPNEAAGQCRPYDDQSAWNTQIPNYQNPSIDQNSDKYMQAIKNNGMQLTSDPTQYSPIIIPVNNSTPKTTVMLLEGNYGWGNGYIYDQGDNKVDKTSTPGNLYGTPQTMTNVPIPANMSVNQIPVNDDAQVVFWNTDTGEEWAFWQFRPTNKNTEAYPNGNNDVNSIDNNTQSSNYTTTTAKWAGTNMTKYHTKTDGSGNRYFARLCGQSDEASKCAAPSTMGTGGRGAGTPYFAGLIRQWEVASGNIEHALSFAYNYPCNQFRYPAAKSDGTNNCAQVTIGGQPALHPPEGTRLQLDPNLTDAQLAAPPYNLTTPQQRTVAHAMQKYGLYIIDNSGRPKLNLEYSNNPNWNATTPLNQNSFAGIPWSAFRVVSEPADPTSNQPPPSTCSGKPGDTNNDSVVNITDIAEILKLYGQTNSTSCVDVNKDSVINISDIATVLQNYGTGSQVSSCTGTQHTPGGPDGMGGCWPGPNNTGVPVGTQLTNYPASGESCTITTPNFTIDKRTVNCNQLTIRAQNVKITNSKINGFPWVDQPGQGSFILTDSEIDGGSGWNEGTGKSDFTITRANIYGAHRGVWCEYNCTVKDSYIHGQAVGVLNCSTAGCAWHESAVRMGSGPPEAGQYILHNTLWCDAVQVDANDPNDPSDTSGCSADLTGYGDFAPMQNNTVDKNLFMATPSGGACAYGGSSGEQIDPNTGKPYKPYGPLANNQVFTNNIFQKKNNLQNSGNCGVWWPITSFNTSKPGNRWENNKWDDGGIIPPAN